MIWSSRVASAHVFGPATQYIRRSALNGYSILSHAARPFGPECWSVFPWVRSAGTEGHGYGNRPELDSSFIILAPAGSRLPRPCYATVPAGREIYP